MLHVSSLSNWSSPSAPFGLAGLRPFVDAVAADEAARPRRLVWSDPLRTLAAELHATHGAGEGDGDPNPTAYVMPA